MKNYAIICHYDATPGVKDPVGPGWLIKPTDSHSAVVGWDNTYEEADRSCDALARDLVGTSNITGFSIGRIEATYLGDEGGE